MVILEIKMAWYSPVVINSWQLCFVMNGRVAEWGVEWGCCCFLLLFVVSKMRGRVKIKYKWDGQGEDEIKTGSEAKLERCSVGRLLWIAMNRNYGMLEFGLSELM